MNAKTQANKIMNTSTALILIAIWWAIGYQSFKYWWTKDFDFKSSDRSTALLIGVLGPLCFLLGGMIHGRDTAKTITKKQ